MFDYRQEEIDLKESVCVVMVRADILLLHLPFSFFVYEFEFI